MNAPEIAAVVIGVIGLIVMTWMVASALAVERFAAKQNRERREELAATEMRALRRDVEDIKRLLSRAT